MINAISLFQNYYLRTILICVFFFTSCKSKSNKNTSIIDNIFNSAAVSPELMQNTLNSIFARVSSDSNDVKFVPVAAVDIYQHHEYVPLWLKGETFVPAVKSLIHALENLQEDGLNIEKYDISRLKNAIATKKPITDSLAVWDVLLTKNYLQAASDLTFGTTRPYDVDKDWFADNDSVFAAKDQLLKVVEEQAEVNFERFRPQNPRYEMMRKELKKWNALNKDSTYLANKQMVSATDLPLIHNIIHKEINVADTEALRSFQYLNNLSVTGKIDEATLTALKILPAERIEKLKINMERLRWLPNEKVETYIWVCIPQAEIDYFKNGNNLFHNRTIVGSKSKNTPTILKPLHNIVICPPWGVPYSIVKNELKGRIPGIYEVYFKGKRVPNNVVNLSNYKRYVVRQPPGPRAALGYVKFNLPNKWDIYLHDTPGRYAFANKLRYRSHGCVRVQDPRRLAALLLEEQNISLDSLNTLIAKNKTKQINTPKIPVCIVYTTVNADSNFTNMIYVNDAYKKDSVLTAALQ